MDGDIRVDRPKLSFSTILTSWKPEFALQIIDYVEQKQKGVKPRLFNIPLASSATEAEKYTLSLLREFCSVAFGAMPSRTLPARKQIDLANARWTERHVPLGKGIDFDGLRELVALYTKHLYEDNFPVS